MNRSQRRRMIVLFVQALLAMGGSLYYQYFGDPFTNMFGSTMFPSGEGFEPCLMCWYARILMYPIVWMSAIALWKNKWDIVAYIVPAIGLGILLETYHYLSQKFVLPFDSGSCTAAVPCDAMWINYFGFMTIPFLCLIAFVVIGIASYKIFQLRNK